MITGSFKGIEKKKIFYIQYRWSNVCIQFSPFYGYAKSSIRFNYMVVPPFVKVIIDNIDNLDYIKNNLSKMIKKIHYDLMLPIKRKLIDVNLYSFSFLQNPVEGAFCFFSREDRDEALELCNVIKYIHMDECYMLIMNRYFR